MHESTSKLTGLLVYYVNVGALPLGKAEEFLERLKTKFVDSGLRDKIVASGYEVFFVPNREVTHLELLKF